MTPAPSKVDGLVLKSVIKRQHGLAELPDALDHLGRDAFGKIVIDLGVKRRGQHSSLA